MVFFADGSALACSILDTVRGLGEQLSEVDFRKKCKSSLVISLMLDQFDHIRGERDRKIVN